MFRSGRALRPDRPGGAGVHTVAAAGAGLLDDRGLPVTIEADRLLVAGRPTADADHAVPGHADLPVQDGNAAIPGWAAAQECAAPPVDCIVQLRAHWLYVFATTGAASVNGAWHWVQT